MRVFRRFARRCSGLQWTCATAFGLPLAWPPLRPPLPSQPPPPRTPARRRAGMATVCGTSLTGERSLNEGDERVGMRPRESCSKTIFQESQWVVEKDNGVTFSIEEQPLFPVDAVRGSDGSPLVRLGKPAGRPGPLCHRPRRRRTPTPTPPCAASARWRWRGTPTLRRCAPSGRTSLTSPRWRSPAGACPMARAAGGPAADWACAVVIQFLTAQFIEGPSK